MHHLRLMYDLSFTQKANLKWTDRDHDARNSVPLLLFGNGNNS